MINPATSDPHAHPGHARQHGQGRAGFVLILLGQAAPSSRKVGRCVRPRRWRRRSARGKTPVSVIASCSSLPPRIDRQIGSICSTNCQVWVLRSDRASACRSSMPAPSVTDSDQVKRDRANVFSASDSAGTRMISCLQRPRPQNPAANLLPQDVSPHADRGQKRQIDDQSRACRPIRIPECRPVCPGHLADEPHHPDQHADDRARPCQLHHGIGHFAAKLAAQRDLMLVVLGQLSAALRPNGRSARRRRPVRKTAAEKNRRSRPGRRSGCRRRAIISECRHSGCASCRGRLDLVQPNAAQVDAGGQLHAQPASQCRQLLSARCAAGQRCRTYARPLSVAVSRAKPSSRRSSVAYSDRPAKENRGRPPQYTPGPICYNAGSGRSGVLRRAEDSPRAVPCRSSPASRLLTWPGTLPARQSIFPCQREIAPDP